MSRMIIANRLDNGRVVFAAADGDWVESIEDGRVLETNEAETALATLLDDPRVIDPNLIDVTSDSGSVRPAAIREAIRADGPTVDVDTGA